jgi:purine-binding chemotaxis protein CheW
MSGAEIFKLATFSVGGGEYALDIMRINQVIQPQKITPVPKVPPFIEGVIELRGAILPVVDLRKRFDLPALPPTRATKYVLVALEGRIVGLVVDAVGEFLRVTQPEISPPPMLSGDAGRFFAGVVRRGGHLYFLLDIDRILTSDEKISLAGLSSLSRGEG